MSNNTNDPVELYLPKKRAGMSFSEIRKELGNSGYDSETISQIIKDIDNRLIEEELHKGHKIKSKQLYHIGLFIMLSGGLATVGTYFGIINLEGIYIVAWGPLISGYLMILASRRIKSKEGKSLKKDNYFKRK